MISIALCYREPFVGALFSGNITSDNSACSPIHYWIYWIQSGHQTSRPVIASRAIIVWQPLQRCSLQIETKKCCTLKMFHSFCDSDFKKRTFLQCNADFLCVLQYLTILEMTYVTYYFWYVFLVLISKTKRLWYSYNHIV